MSAEITLADVFSKLVQVEQELREQRLILTQSRGVFACEFCGEIFTNVIVWKQHERVCDRRPQQEENEQ